MKSIGEKEIKLGAAIENIEKVSKFVDEELDKFGCPVKTKFYINIAIDELFSNIVRYAYESDIGMVTVHIRVWGNPLEADITFIDYGSPYNPLTGEEPDVSLSAEERQIGGLGIYMVKKSMDDITYEYKNGQNILKIKKYFNNGC